MFDIRDMVILRILCAAEPLRVTATRAISRGARAFAFSLRQGYLTAVVYPGCIRIKGICKPVCVHGAGIHSDT